MPGHPFQLIPPELHRLQIRVNLCRVNVRYQTARVDYHHSIIPLIPSILSIHQFH